MKKTLAVYDSDVFYAARFMEYFKNKSDFEFEISAFTLQDSLIAYLKRCRVEILVLGKPVLLEGIAKDNIRYSYQLSEERYFEQNEELPSIFKYQRVSTIMDEIMHDYMKRLDELQVGVNHKTMDIITIFSPKAGFEELSYAWSGAFISAKKRKVLFIPLELIPAHSLSFLEVSKHNLSEFIYYLKEKQDIITKLKALLSYHGNLSYLSGSEHGFDLLALCREDMQQWISELRLYSDYQTVIFYIDHYNDAAVELMQLSDIVMLPTDQSIYQNRVLKEWEEQMQRLGHTIEEDKYQRIILQKEPTTSAGYSSLQELTHSQAWYSATQYCNNRGYA